MLARDEHSSLFGLFVRDEEKKSYDIDTWSKLQNLSTGKSKHPVYT
jgi:hypothetical protein